MISYAQNINIFICYRIKSAGGRGKQNFIIIFFYKHYIRLYFFAHTFNENDDL